MVATRFSEHLLTGDHASRPAAGDVPDGTLYACSDHNLIYQSDTATWATWADIGGTSGDVATDVIWDTKGDLAVATGSNTAQKLTAGTNGTVLIADSAQATGLRWGGREVVYDHITGDETGVTDATLVNTGLSFAVLSGVHYRFRFDIVYRSGSTSVGLKLGLTTPTFTAFVAWVRINLVTAANATGVYDGTIRASGGSVVGVNVEASNTDYPAVVEGIIVPSANGTLMLQYAAETTGTTVTMKAGSCGELVILG